MSNDDPDDGTTLNVRETARGVAFDVDVKVRAKHTRITGTRAGRLSVALAAPPVDGAANESLRRALAQRLRVAPSHVRIVLGEAHRRKVIEVAGVSAAEVVSRLESQEPR
jgi:uncharacterized protein